MVIKFSDETLREFEKIVAKYPRKEAVMLPALHLAQKEWGYISTEVMEYVAKLLEVPPMKVRDVVTFYPMFFDQPVGKHIIRVCHTLPCALANCKTILQHLKNKLNIDVEETTPDGKFTLLKVECLAACDVAPVMMVNDDLYKNLTSPKVDEILDNLK